MDIVFAASGSAWKIKGLSQTNARPKRKEKKSDCAQAVLQWTAATTRCALGIQGGENVSHGAGAQKRELRRREGGVASTSSYTEWTGKEASSQVSGR